MSTQFVKNISFQAIQFSQTVLIQTIQFSISTASMSKTVLFQIIQFSISMQFSSIWPIDRTLSGATTLDNSGPGSNDNKGMLCIPQSSSIIRTSLSNCFVSYPGHSLGEGLTPPQRCSWCVLQPQPTVQSVVSINVFLWCHLFVSHWIRISKFLCTI